MSNSVRRLSRRRGLATAATFALLVITGAACASSGDGDDAVVPASRDAGGSAARTAGDRPADAEQAEFIAADTNSAKTSSTNQGAHSVIQAAVISTGNVAMRSGDVGQAIFDVRKVVDQFRGEVEEDSTETDDDGDALRSRMVLRIPSGRFGDAMEELEHVATLITSSSSSKDVTTAVLDKQVRIQVQRRSIARIAVLLDQATSIRDIVNIESELSRRQADLATLERQSSYLADQTSMSTITVSVERTHKTPTEKKEEDNSGFLAGLSAGWDGLTTFAVGLATVLGVLLPWLLVLAILAIPGWTLMRRLRRRGPTAVTTPG
jgi:hypothetical protein